MDLLTPTDQVTNDRHIGDATHYNLTVNGKTVKDAATMFGEPHATEEGFTDEAPDLRGYVTFAWDKMDSWFEEAEEIFAHPRDPYKRIDCIKSTRTSRSRSVAKSSRRATTRYSCSRRVCAPATTFPRSTCAWTSCAPARRTPSALQGHGIVLLRELHGKLYEDAAWYYPQALPESMPIAGGYVAFYDEKMDAVEID